MQPPERARFSEASGLKTYLTAQWSRPPEIITEYKIPLRWGKRRKERGFGDKLWRTVDIRRTVDTLVTATPRQNQLFVVNVAGQRVPSISAYPCCQVWSAHQQCVMEAAETLRRCKLGGQSLNFHWQDKLSQLFRSYSPFSGIGGHGQWRRPFFPFVRFFVGLGVDRCCPFWIAPNRLGRLR